MQFEPAKEVWRIRPVRWDLAQDNELAARLYRILLKWLPYANDQYRDWDGRPNCGHFFGGNYWYVSDSASTTLVFAIAAKLGQYDEAITGIPREEVKQKAIRTIRYMGFTHDTGPADCVRVQGDLPYTSGKKWGGAEEHYFMATQNGRSVAIIALASLLLWDDMDDETRMLVQNVTSSYADRWCDVQPGNGSYYDTQCEENAWTAAGISAAWTMFPDHPHAEAWKQGVMNWALNAVTRTLDRHRYPSGLIDQAKGPAAKTVTFHPDFTTENHAFVHPAYMAAGINLRAIAVILAQLAGEEPLPVLTHNNLDMYEATLKKWVQFDGLIVPVQGQDWWYNRHHDNAATHAVINVTEKDSEAARLERNAIETIEKLQASNRRGCLLEENPEEYVFNRAHGQFANQLEHGSACDIAYSFLLHTFGGAGAEPARQEDVIERLRGVYTYPFGSVVVHRTADTLSAFSWRNNVMALSLPAKGLWSVTPLFHSYTGIADFAEKRTEKALANEKLILRSEKHSLRTATDGFAAAAGISRGDRELTQNIAFVSLPNGHTVYIEQFEANADCLLNQLHTGYIGIRNEQYGQMPERAPGRRTLTVDGRSETFVGFYGKEPDRVRDYASAGWVNVDDEIGYVLSGSAGVRYINRHQYERWKGVEDLLILNCRDHVRFRRGERTAPFVIVTMPNQSAAATRAAYERLLQLDTGRTDAAALIHGDYLVWANFADERLLLQAQAELHAEEVPLFRGTMQLNGRRLTWRAQAEAFGSACLTSACRMAWEASEGEPELMVNVMDDHVLVANVGNVPVRVSLTSADGRVHEPFTIAGGEFRTQAVQCPI
jgi:hypothetical protein